MGIFSASTRALVQQAIDLMVRGSATQIPLSEDVVYPLGKAAAAAGFMSEGNFRATIQGSPFSTLLTFLTWLDGQASNTPAEIVPLEFSPAGTDVFSNVGYSMLTGSPVTAVNITAVSTISTFTLGGPVLTSITAPVLSSAGSFAVSASSLLTTVSAPMLTTVLANVQVQSCPGLTTLNLNSLATVGTVMAFTGNTVLTALSLPNLISIASTLTLGTSPALTTISLPNLTTVGSAITGANLTGLTTVSFPLFLPTKAAGINFSGGALTAASVNHILARCVASAGYNTGTINLGGGTNAAPTGQGITDKATLITRGHTVTTN